MTHRTGQPLLSLALSSSLALLLAMSTPVFGKEKRQPVLPFRTGSYEEALAEAKERDLPLFVENWAPW